MSKLGLQNIRRAVEALANDRRWTNCPSEHFGSRGIAQDPTFDAALASLAAINRILRKIR